MNDQDRASYQPRPEVSPTSPPPNADPGPLGVVHPGAPAHGNGANGHEPSGPPERNGRRRWVTAASRPEIAARLAASTVDGNGSAATNGAGHTNGTHRNGTRLHAGPAAPTAHAPVTVDPAAAGRNGTHPPRLDRPVVPSVSPEARNGHTGVGTVVTGPDLAPSPEAPEPVAEDELQESGLTKSLIEWVAVLGGAFVVALVIKTYLFQAFFIPSQSMEPALMVNDRVLVNKLSYELHDVERGDLVVFERPEIVDDDDSDLIKRVVGLPGETVDFIGDRVYIDGEPLDEPYLEDGVPSTPPDAERFPMLLGDDEVFVMGDNRTDSRDSRYFGPIKVDTIIGRAWVRVWPVSDFDFL